MPLDGDGVVLYEVSDGIATITLNRPERLNALSVGLNRRLAEVFVEFEKDDRARVAILTGAGEKAFCAGGDLKEFNQLGIKNLQDASATPGLVRYPSATYSWQVSKPVIGAINGYAMAGGFMIALNCDLRVASDNAVFAISEALVGRAAPWSIPLLWAVPSAIGMEMLLTGGRLDAKRAYEVGFVNRVVPAAELMSATRTLATTIAANAPLTVSAHKRLFYRAMDVGRAIGFQIADEICRDVYDSKDCQEGQRAFSEGRAPVWVGQ